MVTKINWYQNKEILEWCWASDNVLIRSPYWTSCYFIDGLLIDAGAPGGVKEFREFILSIGPENVKKCVLTHSHEDHVGGAFLLQDEFRIPLFASKKATSILKKGYLYPQYRQITWGSGLLPAEVNPIPNPIITSTRNYTFEVLPIPGHAPDQIALIEHKQQWVFASDGVQPKYTRIFGATSDIQEDIAEIFRSIQSLFISTKNMNNLTLFLAGKGIISGRSFLGEKMKEIESLHQITHDLFKKGLSEEEIVREIFEGDDFISIMTGGELSRKNLVSSLLDWPIN